MIKIVEFPCPINPIKPSPGFEKKMLSNYHVEFMKSCQAKCVYCSTPNGTYERVTRTVILNTMEEQTGKRVLPSDDSEAVAVFPDLLDRLREQLARKRPDWGEGEMLMVSMLTDAFSPVLVKMGVTEEALRLILAKTRFRIRILTKFCLVGQPPATRHADLPELKAPSNGQCVPTNVRNNSHQG